MLSHSRFMFALDSLKKYILINPATSFFYNPQLIYQNFLIYYIYENVFSVENNLREFLRIPHYISKDEIDTCDLYRQGNYRHKISGIRRSTYATNQSFWFLSPKFVQPIRGTSENSQMRRDILERLNPIFSTCGDMNKIDHWFHIDEKIKMINRDTNLVTQRIYEEDWLDFFPPGSLHKNTSLVMLNAIHIKGVIPITTRNHGKSDRLYAYILEAPYKDINQVSIFFFYPLRHLEYGKENFFDTTENGIIQLIERLTTEEGSRKLRELLNNGMARQLNRMNIPKFRINQNLRMNDLLLGYEVSKIDRIQHPRQKATARSYP